MNETNEKEDDASEAIRRKGVPDGLFDKCMIQIRTAHSIGQSLRTLFVLSGVFSDKMLYSELLTQFYVVTEALERLLEKHEPQLLSSLREQYKGGFAKLYQSDLQYLLENTNPPLCVADLTSSSAKKYIETIQSDISIENGQYRKEALIAGVFILWGPLIIGGGAAMYPRVKSSYGLDATNVFTHIIGSGRSKRVQDFIDIYDALGTDKTLDFDKIVELSGKYMQCNNEMMVAVKRNPKWAYYALYGIIGVLGIGSVAYIFRDDLFHVSSKISTISTSTSAFAKLVGLGSKIDSDL